MQSKPESAPSIFNRDQTLVTEACQKAGEHWGVNSQITAFFEEVAELQVLLAKFANGKKHRVENFNFKLVDELADVHFLLAQLETVFGNSEAVRSRLLVKCESTMKFIADQPRKS